MLTGNLEKPGIVIVNYNSLAYVIEAVESIFSAEKIGERTRIVLVDNASTEHGFDEFEATIRQRFAADIAVARQADHRVSILDGCPETAEIIIIQASRNDGFAAGCNIGLRFLYETDTDFFLLLNPDTKLHHNTLKAFAAKLSSDSKYGLLGATLMNMRAGLGTQACGGASLNPLSLLGCNLGAGLSLDELPSEQEIEQQLSYPVGAAMAFRRDWLEYAGFMDERYFLYYEEADWSRIGRDKYKPGWARNAIVYHHHGAAAGSNLARQERSPLADYHMIRSRMQYALKWHKWIAPLIISLTCVQAIRRILRGQKEQARAVLLGGIPGADRAYQKHA
ncbi:MAG: glycosyltransferase family 2 protein [Aquisalinus sp.]|nr:glycosyltransferase family 2 protein [Aquisalinus sp.]